MVTQHVFGSSPEPTLASGSLPQSEPELTPSFSDTSCPGDNMASKENTEEETNSENTELIPESYLPYLVRPIITEANGQAIKKWSELEARVEQNENLDRESLIQNIRKYQTDTFIPAL